MEQIKAKDFLLYYNPNLDELTISSGMKFIKRTGEEIKIDLNPHGQSKLTEVDFLSLDTEKKTLTCKIDKKSIVLTTKFQINMQSFEFLMGMKTNVQRTENLDKIDLFISSDKLEHLYLSKVKDYVIIDSIRIFFEEEQYFVVKNQPKFIREAIRKMSISNTTINIETENNQFKYRVDTNNEIASFLQTAFNLIDFTR